MKDLSEKIAEVNRFIASKNIITISFDIDGTLYPIRRVEFRWWKRFFLSPLGAIKFLRIKLNWEKRRKGKESVPVTASDVSYFETFLRSLLDSSLISSEVRQWLDHLKSTGITLYFLSDHGAEVKLEELRINQGVALNCLKLTGELKPHVKITDALISQYKINPETHLHLGDRWTDEEQARLMKSHFCYFMP